MILTPRLVLRPLYETDVTEEYLSWFDDPGVQRWITFAQDGHTQDQLAAYITEKRTLPGCWFLGIFINGRHIGNVKYEPDYHGGHHAGILIGVPACRGKGIATEVLRAVTPLVLAAGSWEVWLGVHRDHLAAQRAYEKAGFLRVQSHEDTFRYEWARVPCMSS